MNIIISQKWSYVIAFALKSHFSCCWQNVCFFPTDTVQVHCMRELVAQSERICAWKTKVELRTIRPGHHMDEWPLLARLLPWDLSAVILCGRRWDWTEVYRVFIKDMVVRVKVWWLWKRQNKPACAESVKCLWRVEFGPSRSTFYFEIRPWLMSPAMLVCQWRAENASSSRPLCPFLTAF